MRTVFVGIAFLVLYIASHSAVSDEVDSVDASLPNAARGGELDVKVTPSTLILGQHSKADVLINLTGGKGKIKLFAQHGTVSGVKIVSDDKARAVYNPPEQYMPGVDVVAAMVETDGGLVWGYAVVQLIGHGEAVIRTRPGAEATIRIAGKKFGPVKAGRKGRASIQVEVPPGTKKGVDGQGGDVDLNLPRVPRTAVFMETKKIDMDNPRDVALFAVVVREDGGMDEDGVIEIRCDSGKISGTESMGRGVFRAIYHPPDEGKGKVKVRVSVEGSDLPPAVTDLVLLPKTATEKVEPPTVVPPEIPWLSMGLKGGLAWNFGSMRSFDLLADFGVKLPVGNHRMGVGIQVGFSRSSESSSVDVGASTSANTESQTWIVPLGGMLFYRFALGTRWGLLGAIHGAAVMVDNTVDIAGSDTESHERGYLFGLGGSVALELGLGPGVALMEIEYLALIGSIETLDGNLSPMYFNLGYRFFFL